MKTLKLIVLVVLLCIAGFIGMNWQLFEDNMTALVYRRGPSMIASLQDFDEQMTEADILRRLPEMSLRCVSDPEALPLGDRYCYSNIGSYAGLRALRIYLFLKDGRLATIKVDIPWWLHRQMGNKLVKDLGAPTGAQSSPVLGVRLVGWQLPNGNLLYNRDADPNPLMWNTIFWLSPTEATRIGGVFHPSDNPWPAPI